MSHDLEISNVWMNVSPGLANEIVSFWMVNRMLPEGIDAHARSKQVVLVIRNKGKIVGLTSAEIVRYRQLNNNLFYFFRMIVLPEIQLPGIGSKMVVETRDFLESQAEKQMTNKCIGMITIVENPQLVATRNQAVWPSSKMVYIGNDKHGHHIRVYYFKGAKI